MTDQAPPVVVAIDFAEMTEFVLAEAIKAAAHRGSSLHVVCAIDPSLDVMGTGMEFGDELTRLEEALDARVANPIGQAGLEYKVHAVLGAPATEIVSCARDVGADLIVLGRHSRAQKATVLGSVPAKVLALAHSSVLVVQPTDYRGA